MNQVLTATAMRQATSSSQKAAKIILCHNLRSAGCPSHGAHQKILQFRNADHLYSLTRDFYRIDVHL